MLRFEGLYLSKVSDYCRYLRFYRDGTVIAVSSTGNPQQVARWFDRDHSSVSKGHYVLQGTAIRFSTTSTEGTIDYSGNVGTDALELQSYSHINGHRGLAGYRFIENPDAAEWATSGSDPQSVKDKITRPKYQVLPRELIPRPIPEAEAIPLTGDERKSLKGMSVGAGFVVWVIVNSLVGGVSGSALAGLVVASVAVAITAISIKGNRISELEQAKAEREKRSVQSANENDRRSVEREAELLTSNLNRTYELSAALATELPQLLNSASRWLRKAELEYNENAFSPFWDAVENAARNLAAFNDKGIQLSRNADEYYSKLRGRKHTFPRFPVTAQTMPESTPVMNEFHRVVRLGQTNFQFANIWEHRRTREVLIVGFRTLGEAINNLGVTIENSVDKLQQSISSDVAMIVEEEIRTREALDRRSSRL